MSTSRHLPPPERPALAEVRPISSAPGAAPPSAPLPPAPDPSRRETDLAALHPALRSRIGRVLADLAAAGRPARVVEALRTPERQRLLHLRAPAAGSADAWESLHQYGLEVDLASEGARPPGWAPACHAIARRHGLAPRGAGPVHLALPDISPGALRGGAYPPGGDAAWAAALSAAIRRWPGDDRPPLPWTTGEGPIDWRGLPSVAVRAMGSPFGGRAWRCDGRGVHLSEADAPLRTPGPPVTVRRILALHANAVAAAAARHDVAPELLVMTVATETAAFRADGFTGPATFRWEAHFRLRATGDPRLDGVARGDYSAGPMQVMADTARWLTRAEGLGHDPAAAFPVFAARPESAPGALGLYDPAVCLDVGACYIRRQMGRTEGDPVLVAAAYNAGSLRVSAASPWGLHAHGDHLDRAARWYGDACAVLAALRRG